MPRTCYVGAYLKSSCAPSRGTPCIKPSSEGAKADNWRYNQSITGPREGNPRQKTTTEEKLLKPHDEAIHATQSDVA